MRENHQRWIGKWKKRMEEAEAAKAGQREATELAKLEPTEAKESVAEVYLQQVSAEQQANKRRRGGGSGISRGSISRRKRDSNTSAGRTSPGRRTTPKEKKKLN
jgi:hypothetical protein